MSTPQDFYNQPVVEWARQNIPRRVVVRPLFSSRLGRIFTYSLLFCVPTAFFVLGLVAVALGAKDPPLRYGPFVFAFILLFPCGLIALLGAYVRRGFAKSLDSDGVNTALGGRFPWSKFHYVDHVSKRTRVGRVSHHVKDNQLELVFAQGKVIIPPLIHDRESIWQLINSMPAEVRDDGVPRTRSNLQGGVSPEQALMNFLNAQTR